MNSFSLVCWICAFLNMLAVFVQLSTENYVGAAFNFLIAFVLIYQRVNDLGNEPIKCEDEE
jgi:hypothetical protein